MNQAYIQVPCSMCYKRRKILGPFLGNLLLLGIVTPLYIIVVPKMFSFFPSYRASDVLTRIVVCFFLGCPIVVIIGVPIFSGIQRSLGKTCPSCEGRGVQSVLLGEHRKQLRKDLPTIPQVLGVGVAFYLWLQVAAWLVSGEAAGFLPLIVGLAASMATYHYPRNKLKALEAKAAPNSGAESGT